MSAPRLMHALRPAMRPARALGSRPVGRASASTAVEHHDHGHGGSSAPSDVYTNESLLRPGVLASLAALIAGLYYWNASLKYAPAFAGVPTDSGDGSIEVGDQHFAPQAEDKRLPWLTRVMAFHMPLPKAATLPEDATPADAAVANLSRSLNLIERGYRDAEDQLVLNRRQIEPVKRVIWEGTFFVGNKDGILPGTSADLSNLVVSVEQPWMGRPRAASAGDDGEDKDGGDEKADDE